MVSYIITPIQRRYKAVLTLIFYIMKTDVSKNSVDIVEIIEIAVAIATVVLQYLKGRKDGEGKEVQNG